MEEHEGHDANEIQKRHRLVRETYLEVLDATKHQDDKVGRFLTGMAFLVAGALAFIRPEILGVRYDLGGLDLPMPGLGLGSFILTIVVAALLFLLATSAPLTIPERPRNGQRQRDSHLFFLLIDGYSIGQWRELWNDSTKELHDTIFEEYVVETLNLARRAQSKLKTSNYGSAIFVVALLLFTVTIELAVDVLIRGSQAAGVWSWQLRATIAVTFTIFVLAVLYERLRRKRRDEEGYRHREGFRHLALGYGLSIWALMLPGQPLTPRLVAVVILLGGAVLIGRGYSRALRPLEGADAETVARYGRHRIRIGVACTAGVVLGGLGLMVDIPAMRFFLALVVTPTPLLGAWVRAIGRERRLVEASSAS